MSTYGKTASQSISFGDIGVLLGAKPMPTGPLALQTIQYQSVSNGDKSAPVVIIDAPFLHPTTQRQLIWRIKFSGTPSSVSLKLQASVEDLDGDYVDLSGATYTGTSNGQVIVQSDKLAVYRFFRVVVVTGGYSVYSDITCL